MHLSLDVEEIEVHPLLQTSTQLKYRGIEYTRRRAMHPTEMCNPLAIEVTSNESIGKYRGENITKQNQIKMPVAVEAIINLKYRGITYQIVADPYLYRNL